MGEEEKSEEMIKMDITIHEIKNGWLVYDNKSSTKTFHKTFEEAIEEAKKRGKKGKVS